MHGRLLKVKKTLQFQVYWKARSIYICFCYFYVSSMASKLFLAGKSKEEAMNDYITKVKQLLEAAGLPIWQHCHHHVLLSDSVLEVLKCFGNKEIAVFDLELSCIILFMRDEFDMLLWIQLAISLLLKMLVDRCNGQKLENVCLV